MTILFIFFSLKFHHAMRIFSTLKKIVMVKKKFHTYNLSGLFVINTSTESLYIHTASFARDEGGGLKENFPFLTYFLSYYTFLVINHFMLQMWAVERGRGGYSEKSDVFQTCLENFNLSKFTSNMGNIFFSPCVHMKKIDSLSNSR